MRECGSLVPPEAEELVDEMKPTLILLDARSRTVSEATRKEKSLHWTRWTKTSRGNENVSGNRCFKKHAGYVSDRRSTGTWEGRQYAEGIHTTASLVKEAPCN